ncbi:MAG TPA: WD40 repeat domain-containing protein [Anaerolineae bacterium]
MSAQFDWQTEEEDTWEESEQVVAASPGRTQPSWRLIVLILIALALAAIVLYWQATQRIELATQAVQADVLSSHRLIHFAAAQRDVELAEPLLSGRDPDWTSAQKQLVEQGLFLDRSAFGLHTLPATTSPAPIPPAPPRDGEVGDDLDAVDITVSTDFRSAELLFAKEYQIGTDRQVTETVILQQTAVYRQGSQRWLLSPPEKTFWGDRDSLRGDIVTVSYPVRDEAIATQLADALDAILADMCRRLRDIDCPADLRVYLRLDTSPDSLVAVADPANLLTGSLRLALPSPTLVGKPVDEAGYEALYRGYATQVVSAAITSLVGWECCQHAPVYQLLLDYQLSQLGLRSWPITQADHLRILEESASLNNLMLLWSDASFTPLNEERKWQVYAAVDFLLHHFPDVSAADMQRKMTPRRSLLAWLTDIYPLGAGSFVLDELDREWWIYAYTQTLVSQAPPPVPLPEQDIQLLCMTEVPDLQMSLYRYHTVGETWVEEFTYPGFVFMNPLPRDDGLIVQRIAFEDEVWQMDLWRDATGLPLSVSHEIIPEGGSAISLGQIDPAGQQLLAYTLPAESDATEALLVNFHDCEGGVCPSQLLPGPLVWSPSGTQVIAVENAPFFNIPLVTGGRVALFDMFAPVQSWTLLRQSLEGAGGLSEDSFVKIGQGYAPFWLDESSYGFVRVASGASQELVVASVSDDISKPLLSSATLGRAIFDGAQSPSLTILYAVAHPASPNLLFIIAKNAQQNDGYIISFERETGRTALRLQLGLEPNHTLAFSPDGRWLAVTGSSDDIIGRGAPMPTLYLHDIAANQTRTFITDSSNFAPVSTLFDWSADGQWLLLIMDSGLLDLVALDHDYQRLLQHDFGQCTALAWVNP